MSAAQRGYSLLELVLVVVVMGIIAALAISITPRVADLFKGRSQAGLLATLDEAMAGYALLHSRLPCPDNDGDGMEDCAGPAVGGVPYRSMGLAAPAENARGLPLRYAVYRKADATPAQDADLAVLKNRYVPLLPGSPAFNTLNGLDLCLALRSASRSPGGGTFTHVGVGVLNVAYVIADPGALDADQVNGVFDGLNAAGGVGFAQPDQAQGLGYDDAVRAVGFNALASRLGCPQRFAQVNGLARAAYAAADLARLALFYKQFRDFAVRVRQTDVDIAMERRDLAIASEAIAVATVASGLALTSQSAGIGAGSVAGATAALTAATATLALAIINLNTANGKLTTALNRQTNASTALSSANAFAQQRLAMVANADLKGLLP